LALPLNVSSAENVAQGVKVIVLDAGHGGCFPGARYNNINEKDINLQVVLKLGAMIEKNIPNVKVVYTRTVDKMHSETLGVDLQARADIAHKNKGDLFISIHSNAHNNREVRGVETIIMGESTTEQQRNENALYLNNKEELLDMSDQKTAAIVRAYIQNLQFTYGEYSEMMARLIQEEYSKLGLRNRGVRRQLLKVLYATDMPSVLTEIGFMSNAEDLAYITSDKGQEEICNAIFNAINVYITNVNRALLLDTKQQVVEEEKKVEPQQPVTPEPVKQRVKADNIEKRYAIQIMANAEIIPLSHAELKSYKSKAWILESSSTTRYKYKYCVGDFADKASAQEMLKEVRNEFPQAFIITFERERP
jgi:N-acetylmuramoyl-L-alanine amidase